MMTRQNMLYHYITKNKSNFSIKLPATKQLKVPGCTVVNEQGHFSRLYCHTHTQHLQSMRQQQDQGLSKGHTSLQDLIWNGSWRSQPTALKPHFPAPPVSNPCRRRTQFSDQGGILLDDYLTGKQSRNFLMANYTIFSIRFLKTYRNLHWKY